jgi:hypothetical protein
MLRHTAQPASVEKNMVIRTMHIHEHNNNLDTSYETNHIIYVVLGKLCTIAPNIVAAAHIQSLYLHGGVYRNIVPNILKHP